MNKTLPDLMILDIMMPKVDGYEVCQQVKSREETNHIKVIFLSAKTKDDEIKKGYEMGADLYLTKPFSTRFLLQQIEELKLLNV